MLVSREDGIELERVRGKALEEVPFRLVDPRSLGRPVVHERRLVSAQRRKMLFLEQAFMILDELFNDHSAIVPVVLNKFIDSFVNLL